MTNGTGKLAVVTGASSGIGFELAQLVAADGYDLIIAADETDIHDAAAKLKDEGANVVSIVADLSDEEGVEELVAEIAKAGRPVDLLFANAGRGLGHGFLDQDDAEWLRVIDTNIVGTLLLIKKVGRQMRERGEGRILSIAGFMPGTFQAVYNGTKAFIDSFSFALREELRDTGVTVTCLMPGPTETRFFERAGLLDTKVGQDEKDDPADVAKAGYDAVLAGEGDVVSGWKNKIQSSLANVTPAETLAKQHRKMAEPGSADR
ncbi:oxidoreductase [Bosea sp. Root381]|uniref:SDR family NAD(P)-dependent oxidoreductase n=1 Tax=Bosea sp. Root381 TaxID=1736524 RepID=UPI0006F7456F|nr:SDR family NAD(P)-dependent oxidoreductase [Bosea sp. Root381]KRE13953.1 oxidoreductase [Bosea sp. Root381]